jgi:hypothetical protein
VKTLNFFNLFHNGDLHSGREFVKDVILKLNSEDNFYYHSNSNNVLADIDVKFVNVSNSNKPLNMYELYYEDSDNIYINTWYNPHFGHKHYGCTIEALYYNFNIVYEKLNIPLHNIEDYIPTINYNKYHIGNVDDFFKNSKFSKYVFISNGNTKSGQSNNENLENKVENLSTQHSDYLFILSDKNNINKENVVFSRDIIKSSGCDLNENSYISTKCDVIIGRESGPFFFSYVKENVLTEKKQTIIDICNCETYLSDKYYNKNKKFTHLNEKVGFGVKDIKIS